MKFTKTISSRQPLTQCLPSCPNNWLDKCRLWTREMSTNSRPKIGIMWYNSLFLLSFAWWINTYIKKLSGMSLPIFVKKTYCFGFVTGLKMKIKSSRAGHGTAVRRNRIQNLQDFKWRTFFSRWSGFVSSLGKTLELFVKNSFAVGIAVFYDVVQYSVLNWRRLPSSISLSRL